MRNSWLLGLVCCLCLNACSVHGVPSRTLTSEEQILQRNREYFAAVENQNYDRMWSYFDETMKANQGDKAKYFQLLSHNKFKQYADAVVIRIEDNPDNEVHYRVQTPVALSLGLKEIELATMSTYWRLEWKEDKSKKDWHIYKIGP